MYRTSEYRIFSILSFVANILALGSLTTIVACLFILKETLFRDLAFILLVFSGFFKAQIFMYKMIIIEKRMLHLVEPSLQHFEVASKNSALSLILYFALFWLTLVLVLSGYILLR